MGRYTPTTVFVGTLNLTAVVPGPSILINTFLEHFV